MSKDLIRLEDVTKYYTSSSGVGLGLHKVNLSFNLGEFVVITGSSGSGKTTLLNVITGMDTYEEGAIFVEGEDTTYFGSTDYENFRRKYISFIFQNYNLVDSFTAYQNVELALIARGIPKKERKKQVIEMLKQVGLEKRMNHRVTRLSGGEKQRVSIARALCSDAPIIACDEITGNLDMATSIEIIELLKKLSKGKLVLLVSHDVNEAIDYATRVIVMHDGSVDKDYLVNQENADAEKEEVNNTSSVVRKIDKVSFKDTVGLAVRTLISTPSKFIFLLTIALFFTLFLFVGVMTYHYMVDVSFIILEEETTADTSSYNNRVIIRKDDNSIFTNEEINSFSEYKNVSAVIPNDIFFDTKINYAFDEEVSEQLYSEIILPSGVLKFSDLRYGRLPRNENEVVLVHDRDFLGKTVYMAVSGDDSPRVCTVVGLLPTSSNKAVYVHDNIIPSIVNRLEMNDVIYYYNFIPENRDLAMLAGRKYNWYIDESLGDDQLRVEWHIPSNVSDVTSQPYLFDGMPIDLYFLSNNTTLQFEKMDIDFFIYSYPREENRVLTGKEELLEICDKTSRNNEMGSARNCYVSPANYEKIMNFNLQNFQVSVLVDNETNVEKVVSKVETGAYYCSAKALIVNENQVLLATVLEVVVVVAVIAISLGLSLIVYSIIKNILNSQHKAFLIMRSLGIDGNKIAIQVYIELAFTLVVNFVIAFVLWCVLKLRNFGGFFASMHKATFGTIFLIYVVSIVVFAILGFKYSSSVIKSSIVNKEME